MRFNDVHARDRLRLEQEERATARLYSIGTKENRSKGDQTVVRQARLARQRVHSEESSAASIDVELA